MEVGESERNQEKSKEIGREEKEEKMAVFVVSGRNQRDPEFIKYPKSQYRSRASTWQIFLKSARAN